MQPFLRRCFHNNHSKQLDLHLPAISQPLFTARVLTGFSTECTTSWSCWEKAPECTPRFWRQILCTCASSRTAFPPSTTKMKCSSCFLRRCVLPRLVLIDVHHPAIMTAG